MADHNTHTLTCTVRQVKKRDGRLQDFDEARIIHAVERAFGETGETHPEQAAKLVALGVMEELNVVCAALPAGSDCIPDVEEVQNLVEMELMKQHFPVTAKAYILYRARRAEQRQEQERQDLERVESAQLSVVLRDGTKVPYNESEIRSYVTDNATGYSAVSVDEIITQLRHNIFDGITITEINQALVMVAKAGLEKDPEYGKLAARILINEMNKLVVGYNEFDSEFATSYQKVFIEKIREGVEKGRYDERMGTAFDLEKLATHLDPQRDREFEYRGIQVLWDRYCIRDREQHLLETPQYFWMRIAMGQALLEGNPTERAIEFYDLISQMLYVPSSPTLIHAGQPRAQMSSCYLNTVEDDLQHIFKVYGDNAQMSKWSGGIGTDWTNVRATNAIVKAINQPSQGVIPFIKIADSVTASINRSGKRRSAAAVYLEVWHLDYEFFLDLRKNTGDERRRTHDLNTVSWIPDLFMKRVASEGMWTLFSPHDVPDLHHIYGHKFEEAYLAYEQKAERGEIELFKQVPAIDLWRKMITMLFETGHPWMTFKDPCNIRSPQDHVGVVHNSNLCTEITLNTSQEETAVCNLGSISLWRHLNADNTDFDWDKIKNTIAVGMRMIDNVIDLSFYPTIEGERSNKAHRPVGLGIMGYQDALFRMNIPFDTLDAVSLSDKMMEFISYYAILTSTELAREKGQYESFPGSKWDRGLLPQDTIALLESERGISTETPMDSWMDWAPVRSAIKQYGMRNSNCMAIAPTATIGNISNSLPSFEPIYKNLYVKSNFSGDFTVVNEYLVHDLKKLGLWNQAMLEKIKYYDGSIQSISEIPAHLKELYKETFELDAIWTLKHAQVRGKWIDQSQSLNIFSRSTSGRALSEIYMNAWKMGIKTTYYLRSLGATAVEKSTLDINKKYEEITEKYEEGKGNADVPETEKTTITDKPKPKLHVYVDQTCESCQ
jgi:ribonucleoside-diphosphate reductase alpha chain